MNIFQTVINAPAASGADITDAGGFITITGLSKPIPKGSIVSARRVVVGEKPQVWTVTIPGTPGNNVTYNVSVSGKSPVTGILKSFVANYTTGISTSQATLSNGLAAALVSSEAPYTVSGAGTATLTITAKSGTPNITVGSSLLTVANATVAFSATGSAVSIATDGVVTGTGTALSTDLTVGAAFYTANAAGTVALTGYVAAATTATAAKVVPSPNAVLATTPGALFLMDNTGLAIENTYAYASLPGVPLDITTSPALRYVVYEIDALDRLNSGNGARPDSILQKYVIYVKSTDTNVWTASTGFDAKLATVCGTTF